MNGTMMRRVASVLVPKRGLRNVYGLVLVKGNSTVAATAASSTVVESLQEWEDAKPYHTIPGPKPLPLIGNGWRFLPGIGTFGNLGFVGVNEALFRGYGNIVRLTGVPGVKDMIMLFDNDDIEKVFRNEGVWPIREGLPAFEYYRKVTRKEFYEDAGGLVTTQGEEWGNFRSAVNQSMMQPRVARNYIGPIEEVTDDFIKRVHSLRDGNDEMPADFINQFYKWGLESMSRIALDIRLGCFEDNLAPDSEPNQMIDAVLNMFDCIYMLTWKLQFWRLISTPTWRRYVKSSDTMNKIVMKYVDQAMERLKTMPFDSDRELSVLELILARNQNPKIACVMAIDMMTAGIDTTSNTTAFLLYNLATNPDKQKKLQEEIDRELAANEPITPQTLNNMKYLKACMKESMRISPIVIGTFRSTGADMVLHGYRIPKGTDVLMHNQIISRFESNYPEADKYIPERWLKGEAANDHKPHPFVSLPFGFGPRTCIGRRFAELEVQVLAIKMFQKFTLEWHHGPMKIESKLINTVNSPLKYKIINRK